MDEEIVSWLGSSEALAAIKQIREQPQASLRDAKALRREYGSQRAIALSSVAHGRSKAIEKWSSGEWLVTDRGIQQATDRMIAQYKAARVPHELEIWDWCCGVGGESMQLSRRGNLVAVDNDPVVLAMARHNVAAFRAQMPRSDGYSQQFVCDDVFNHPVPNDAWLNVDPDRRPGDRRATRHDLITPSLEQLFRHVANCVGASVKLAPATLVPNEMSERVMRQWISHRGSCRQQVIWMGEQFAPDSISATTISNEGVATSFETDQLRDCTIAKECEAYVFDLDPAVRASGLSQSYACHYNLRCLGGPSGYYTADHADCDRLAQPFLVIWHGAADLRRIRKAVREAKLRIAEVKTRGIGWDPHKVQRQFSESGEAAATLLVSRAGRSSHAIIAQRLEHS